MYLLTKELCKNWCIFSKYSNNMNYKMETSSINTISLLSYKNTYTQLHIDTLTHVYIYTCTDLHVYTLTHIHLYICTTLYSYTLTHVYTYTYTLTDMHLHINTITLIHPNTCTH